MPAPAFTAQYINKFNEALVNIQNDKGKLETYLTSFDNLRQFNENSRNGTKISTLGADSLKDVLNNIRIGSEGATGYYYNDTNALLFSSENDCNKLTQQQKIDIILLHCIDLEIAASIAAEEQQRNTNEIIQPIDFKMIREHIFNKKFKNELSQHSLFDLSDENTIRIDEFLTQTLNKALNAANPAENSLPDSHQNDSFVLKCIIAMASLLITVVLFIGFMLALATAVSTLSLPLAPLAAVTLVGLGASILAGGTFFNYTNQLGEANDSCDTPKSDVMSL